MDVLSPLPAVAALLVAVATSAFLVKLFGAPPAQGRYASIDGLRGYLAFFVFLHHASIWYFYLHTGQWKVPPSHLYTHFGQSSVALFFMITGFLFFSKLLEGKTGGIDWGKLFVSRLLRLVPLYFFVVLLLCLLVAYLSHGTLNEPILKLCKGIVRWLGFTIFGSPDLNGIEHTSTIVARVTWSLPYEWFFYLSLPLLALVVGIIPPWPYIAIGVASVIGLIAWWPEAQHLLSFSGGIAACFFVRLKALRQFAGRKMASFVSLACLSMAIAFYPSSNGAIPFLLLTVVFTLFACGDTLFGLLVNPVSRTLGEMAYSIYLLQGIALFICFNFILDLAEARSMSPMSFWISVIGITPVLVLVSFVTFRLIERPAMRSTTSVMAWLRSNSTLQSQKRST